MKISRFILHFIFHITSYTSARLKAKIEAVDVQNTAVGTEETDDYHVLGVRSGMCLSYTSLAIFSSGST